jgi:hypothetical protein
MKVASLARADAFTTADGSTIRELWHSEAQSLAEASLEPGRWTRRHYHRASEGAYPFSLLSVSSASDRTRGTR